jgi:hypothetical protein
MIQHEALGAYIKFGKQLLQKNFPPDIGTDKENLKTLLALHTHAKDRTLPAGLAEK